MLRAARRAGISARQYATQKAPKSSKSPTDFLVGLAGKPESREAADADATAWLESFQSLRQDLKPEATATFQPSKYFAPEDASEDYTLIEDFLGAETRPQAEFTEAQLQKAAALEDVPIPPLMDETMDYLTNVIMRHGRKARARRTLNRALYLVFLQTRKDPVTQLKEVLDKMAPLVWFKRFSDGGARAELVPMPRTERQRLRQAWVWILEASDRRQSRDFSVRLAEEILSAIGGRSPGFDKKVQQHKMAIQNRAFVSLFNRK